MTNTDDLTIRKYRDSDLSNLLACFRKNVPDYFDPKEENEFIHFIHHERDHFYVAEHKTQVLGCCGVVTDPANKLAKISWIFFDPQAQGKGIGRKLVEKCEDDAIQENCNRIIARTSQKAFPFFQKMDYELQFTEKDYWGEGHDLYFTKKPLI